MHAERWKTTATHDNVDTTAEDFFHGFATVRNNPELPAPLKLANLQEQFKRLSQPQNDNYEKTLTQPTFMHVVAAAVPISAGSPVEAWYPSRVF